MRRRVLSEKNDEMGPSGSDVHNCLAACQSQPKNEADTVSGASIKNSKRNY